jgi:hypothetical protein
VGPAPTALHCTAQHCTALHCTHSRCGRGNWWHLAWQAHLRTGQAERTHFRPLAEHRRPVWWPGGLCGGQEACVVARRPVWWPGGLRGGQEACVVARGLVWWPAPPNSEAAAGGHTKTSSREARGCRCHTGGLPPAVPCRTEWSAHDSALCGILVPGQCWQLPAPFYMAGNTRDH